MSGMSTSQALDVARAQARETLSQSEAFTQLPLDEQFAIYRQTVDGLTQAMTGNGERAEASAMAKKAQDLLDDARHESKRIEQAGELAGDFVREVNFPQFVKDLLEGVFQANLHVTLEQMEAYQKLLKEATKSVSAFINKIDNTAAFGYLAENQGDEFSLDFSDEDKSAENPDGAVLTDKSGQKLDLGDNEVKAKIMDAKIAMAREQRAMLREVILMGVSRLVVEKGNVKAGVIFDFKATEQVKKADKAGVKDSRSSGTSVSHSGGIMGSIFGGPSGGHTSSRKHAEISVSSAKSTADTALTAKLTGSVDITFKSDYFKLDNFATMYGPITQGAPPPGTPGAAPGAAPPLPAGK